MAPVIAPILLVEDNRVHREVAASVLQRHGLRVIQARDGEEALARLLQCPVSLVLMDVEMPWMNGIRAAERMGDCMRRGDAPTVPIIGITADHTPETEQRCLAAGMQEVIPKHIWKPRWEHLIMSHLAKWLQPPA